MVIKKSGAFLLLSIFCFSLLFLSACGAASLEKISERFSNYTLNLIFDDSDNTLSGTEKVEYKNIYDSTLNEIKFHLYPNAFRQGAIFSPVSLRSYSKAYPSGFSSGKIDIFSVEVDGRQVAVLIEGNDENILSVSLFEELYPGDSIWVEIVFKVLLPNCNHRFGYGDNTYNFGNFYPVACVFEKGEFVQDNYGSIGDPFYSDMANYNVTITCDDDFTVATSGKQTNQSIHEGKKTTSIRANAVRDFAFVLSRKFSVITATTGKTTVYYYFYDDQNAEQSLRTGVKAIETFSTLFGEYPYETFSVVKTNFLHGGMEYPNLVYISDALESYDDYLNVIIHETAHQWWYNMVGSNACEYAWLDEGLTEFSTLLFYRDNSEYGVNMKERLNASLSSYILFSEIYESVYGNFDGKMNKNVNEFSGEMDYTYIAYVKGVLFFDSLESAVGHKNFLKALKHYFKQNKYTNATPDDLISSFEMISRRSLEGFFNSWIQGKVILQNYK